MAQILPSFPGAWKKGCLSAVAVLALSAPAWAQGPPSISWQGSHNGLANAVAFSPDGQIVASGSADRTTKLWRAADGTLLRTLVQCSGLGCRGPAAVAFSPDGQMLATAGSSLKLWNVADGSLIRTINVGVAAIAFSPDGQTLAGSGGSGYNNVFVLLIRVADGTTLRSLTGGGGPVAFSPSGALVGAVGRRGLDLWNVAGGQPVRHLDGARSALAFSPDGAFVAVAGNGTGDYRYDATITIYRVKDGGAVRTLKRTGAVTSLVYSGDGQTLLSGSWDPNESFVNGYVDSTGSIRFWNAADGSVRATFDRETGTAANSLAVAPGGEAFGYTHDSSVVVAQFPATACAMAIAPDSTVVPLGGGDGSVEVSAPPGCHWTAASRVDWIRVTGGGSGEGDGSVTFSVDSSASAAATGGYDGIVGQVIIANQSFLVSFGNEGDGCYFALQPDHATFAASGGDGSLFVYSPSGCSWRAESNASWIVPSAEVHSGDGGVGYHVDPFATPRRGATQRTGTFTVGDSTFTVTQLADACTYSLSNTAQAVAAGGGSQTVAVSTRSGCTWTAASNDPWLHVTSGASGSGDGSASYYVDANPSQAARTGTLTVAGQALTVNQAGVDCTVTISPLSRTFTASGGNAFVDVEANDICAWTAHSNADWITLTAANGKPGGSGGGTGWGTVYYAVAASSGPERTGTIAIGGQTFTVLQGAAATQGAPDVVWLQSAHAGGVNSVAISPGGQLVASGGADGVVKLWRLADGSPVATLAGHYEAVNAVTFSADGRFLASASQDRSIKLWDVATGTLVRSLGSTEFVLSAAFSPDGQRLASGGGYPDNALKYWRLADGQNVGIYQDGAGQVDAVAYSYDGRLLAAGRANGTIRVENLLDYQQNFDIDTGEYGVSSLAFSADGQVLASGSAIGQNVKLWSAGGQLLRTLTGPSGFVNSVALHPNGETLVSGGEASGSGGHGTLLFWRVADGALLAAYAGETAQSVNSVEYSPDGRFFAFGRSDGTVVLARTP